MTCVIARQCRFYSIAGVSVAWVAILTLLREPLAISVAISVAVKFGLEFDIFLYFSCLCIRIFDFYPCRTLSLSNFSIV